MKFTSLLSLFAGVLFAACSAPADAKTLKLNPKRLIEIIDVIDSSVVDAAQKIDNMANESKDPIDLMINSPGGSVMFGYMLVDSVNAARAKGVTVRCAVGILAASMAFNLLAACTERYALPNAAMLFHPPRVMSREPLTVPLLLNAASDLTRIINSTTGAIVDMMGMNDEEFSHHFHAETMWTASALLEVSGNDWITIVDNIQGSDKVFTHEKQSIFNLLFGQASASSQPYVIVHESPIPETLKDYSNGKN